MEEFKNKIVILWITLELLRYVKESEIETVSV